MSHRIIALLLALILALTITGCSSSLQNSEITDPTRFYEEVRDGYLIDAEVVPFSHTPKAYVGVEKEFTEEECAAFLEFIGDSLIETAPYDYENYYGYEGTTGNGGYINCQYRKSGNGPGDLIYRTPESDRWYGNTPLPTDALPLMGIDMDVGYSELFAEPVDFSFCSADEAADQVRSALAILGMESPILMGTLYVSTDALAELSVQVSQDEAYQDMEMPEDWSEADQGYIMAFAMAIDDIPVTYHLVVEANNPHYSSTIFVYYTESGITYLWIESPWVQGDVTEESETILSATEALEIARIRLDATLDVENLRVYKVAGEYYYRKDGSSFELRPAWVVYWSFDSKTSPSTREATIYAIDALTGEELY